MKRAIILQHVEHEGPGRIAWALARAGFEGSIERLHAGDPVPGEVPDGDVLVVMGGPMGVGDLGRPEYPFLEHEVRLIQRALAAGRPVLGVCLGSQLLAHAAGARVYPATRPAAEPGAPRERVYEVGWGPIDFHGTADHPVLAGLSAQEIMLHWHGDTFDPPPGSLHLASSSDVAQQFFQIGRRVFGIQFHPEVDEATVERWIAEDPEFVARANGPDGAARIRADTRRYLETYRAVGDRLLANVIASMAAR